MVKRTPQDSAVIHFRTPDAHAWAEAAAQELSGADPFEKLPVLKHGLRILPYYKKSDQDPLAFTLPVSDSKILGARAWQNMAAVNITEERKANAEALQYLNTGADGILFVVSHSGINFSIVLADISLEHCAVSWLLEPGCEGEAERYSQWVGGRTTPGCIFYKRPENAVFPTGAADLVSCGIFCPPDENPVNELADALAAGVALLDKFTDQGFAPQRIADQIGFYIQVEVDFFLSIAKLKALRMLWRTVLSAYSIRSATYIHAVSTPWVKDSLQPHGNLIKATTAALSAVAGGCDYLTVLPESESEPGNRAARLVSNVLREESHLAKVADPTAGSYYLDSLIHQLVEKSWQQFLTKSIV